MTQVVQSREKSPVVSPVPAVKLANLETEALGLKQWFRFVHLQPLSLKKKLKGTHFAVQLWTPSPMGLDACVLVKAPQLPQLRPRAAPPFSGERGLDLETICGK